MRRLSHLAGVAAFASLIAGSLGAPAAIAQPRPGPALATPDFIKAAAQIDEFERREGRLAATHAADPKVKAFGRMMVADHTKTTAGLKAAIRRDHMRVPPPPALTGDQTRMVAMLEGMRGRDFDRAYIGQQVDAHRMALDVMRGYAAGGADQPIREAAAKTAPIVEHHLSMAEALRDGH